MGTDLLGGVNGAPSSAKWTALSIRLSENYSFVEKMD